jgi:tripartite-type tricarboxylate transporter receptor subunit TctC
MKLPRRRFLHLAAGAAALPAVSRMAWAQAYPTRPVRIIVGTPAGGQPDIIARLMGQWLSERLGQPFIIENRPGAGSNIATEAVVRAPADGHTLGMASATSAINATLYDNLKFNFMRDTAAVASIGYFSIVLIVHPSFPAKTVSEFLDYSKSNPGKVSLATPSKGTGPYMAAALFKMMTGIDLVQVPYRGDIELMTDILGGQVQAGFTGITPSIENIKAGKLRALAVTTAERVEELPDVPTIGASVPGYEASGWSGIFATKNTPIEIIDRLNKEIGAGLIDLKIKGQLAKLGITVLALSPADFSKFIADETDKWGKVVKFAGVKPD